MRSNFELGRFVEDCRAALGEQHPQRAVHELTARVVSDPASVLHALGEPARPAIQRLYHAPDLTILNVIWAPFMTRAPHDHRMWAVIGVYEGREDNIFWRRLRDDPAGKIEAGGARALSTKEACLLGHDIIHSVTNPIPRLTGALHVYGGDFFATPRSDWDPETLLEQPYDLERTLRQFDSAGEPRR